MNRSCKANGEFSARPFFEIGKGELKARPELGEKNILIKTPGHRDDIEVTPSVLNSKIPR